MIRLPMLLVALSTPISGLAQNEYDGARRLGEAIFGAEERKRHAYNEGLRQAAERENAISNAMEARARAEIIRMENAARERLKTFWMSTGLTEQEAISVASEFRIEEKQISINIRAQRDGIEKTLVRALRAYENYDYLLANQMLIGAERIAGTTPEQLSAAQKAVEAEKARIGIQSGNP
ncbi:MAG: hypothetical protein KF800_14980 [Lysobacter sp.]|nr:hypothetical protein [Lysobacter sp.]